MVNEEEQSLTPVEVKIEDLSKEELVRLLNDRDIALGHYKNKVELLEEDNKGLINMYNADMKYMSTIQSNIIKVQRKKEDAINMIMSGILTLSTIERDEIAPERKENE